MRRSRTETAETRERIISTASKMFLEKGLAAVGMRDIMGAANLTQGGFYRHFDSKEQLIAEANIAAFDRLLTMFENNISGKSPAEALERIVFLYLNQSQIEKNTYLCPLPLLGAELSHCDPAVRAIVAEGYARLVQLIEEQLTQFSKAEASIMASGIVSTMTGAVLLANIAPDAAAARAVLSNAQAFIRYQVSGGEGLSRTRVGGTVKSKPTRARTNSKQRS
jgi:TetR/AcrR family transcriptional regulator, transcriptional repressor for nem operon